MSVLNKLIVAVLPGIPKFIVGHFSRPYIAGTHVEDAVRVVRDLNRKGMMATLDVLGEDIREREQALALKDEWSKVFQHIVSNRLDSNISVKLTQLGLNIDVEFCYQNLRSIAETARAAGNFVRIDMEDSSTTDRTISIYKRLRSDGFDNIGIVLQAYMHRSADDARALMQLGANFRLCKGIYIEPPEIAFQEREEVQRNYVLLLRIMLEGGSYVGIATHDDYLIEKSMELIRTLGVGRDQYEFQMLLGVKEKLRDRIVQEGHRLRVYVPFGEQWYAYSVRRLKENPQIAGYVAKSLFSFNGS